MKSAIFRAWVTCDDINYSDPNFAVVGRFRFFKNTCANCVDPALLRLFPSCYRSRMSRLRKLSLATSAYKTGERSQGYAKKSVDH